MRRSAGAARSSGARPGASRSLRPARPASTTAGSRATLRTSSGSRSGSPLTTRAALLGLVVCTLVFSAVLPLRTYLAQRAEIASLEQEQAETRERVAGLEHAKQQLQDPAFVAAEARRRLHMALPGEVTYVVIPPSPAPEPVAEDTAPAGGPDAPWWSQVWASVHEADRAGAEPAPAPAP